MDKKYTIHVDMSSKFYENKNVAVSCIAAENREFHRGIILKKESIKELRKKYGTNKDFARLYAIFIFWILKEDITSVKKIIICDDEPFVLVETYLKILFTEVQMKDIELIDLFEYRRDLGKNIRSLADNIARSYRKRGLNPNRFDWIGEET